MDSRPELLEELSQHLVWRIGVGEKDDLLIVRVGLASTTSRFAQYPKLRNVSDGDIETMVKEDRVKIEWVS